MRFPRRVPTVHPTPRLAIVAALALAYVVAAELGPPFAYAGANATAAWPPGGVALAALLIAGYDVWPGVLLGAWIANLVIGGSPLLAIPVAVGQLAEALAAAYLVNRYAGGFTAVERTRDFLKFAFFAGLVSATINPTIGVTSLALGGVVPWIDYGTTWAAWWFGGCVGNLVVAPALLLWRTRSSRRWTRGSLVEVAALAACLALVGTALFGGLLPREHTHYPVEFLCVPVLIWAAYRFSPRITGTVVVVMGGIAIRGTLAGYGPFASLPDGEALALLQAFLGVSSLTSLAFALVVSEHRAAEEQLRHLAVTDPLTGLANQRELTEALAEEAERANRTGREFAILFIDVDDLKGINDAHGHVFGSRAICRVARAIRASCRTLDLAARYGGDEFVLLLPESGEAAARRVAHRIEARLRRHKRDPVVTACIGLAVFPRDGASVETLLRAADAKLYEAKALRRTLRATVAAIHSGPTLAT